MQYVAKGWMSPDQTSLCCLDVVHTIPTCSKTRLSNGQHKMKQLVQQHNECVVVRSSTLACKWCSLTHAIWKIQQHTRTSSCVL